VSLHAEAAPAVWGVAMRWRTHLSKYQPLTDYLAALPAATVTLTFPEIEAIIGTPLPMAARQRSYWANSRRGQFAGPPWLRAGWRVAGMALRQPQPTVHFVRVASATTI
jgi:hypothetical protein